MLWSVLGWSLAVFLTFLPDCPAEGWVTSGFGPRLHPVTGRHGDHRGIDVGNVRGTPVRSAWPGTVLQTSRSRQRGRYVVVRSGTVVATYMHLDEVMVSRGQQVSGGELLGLMGASGRTTGTHLHLEAEVGGELADPGFLLATCPVLP